MCYTFDVELQLGITSRKRDFPVRFYQDLKTTPPNFLQFIERAYLILEKGVYYTC